MKLNLGAEKCVLPTPEWANLDKVKVHPDVVQHDFRTGLPYPRESVEVVYGGNFFDHLTYYEALDLLKEIKRVLLPYGKVYFSIMDTDTLINAYLSHNMEQYDRIQPPFFKEFTNSTKFATFLLGNLSISPEYMGHKMLYTPQSIQELFWKVELTCHVIEPDFTKEPWCVENPLYRTSNLYVEGTK